MFVHEGGDRVGGSRSGGRGATEEDSDIGENTLRGGRRKGKTGRIGSGGGVRRGGHGRDALEGDDDGSSSDSSDETLHRYKIVTN